MINAVISAARSATLEHVGVTTGTKKRRGWAVSSHRRALTSVPTRLIRSVHRVPGNGDAQSRPCRRWRSWGWNGNAAAGGWWVITEAERGDVPPSQCVNDHERNEPVAHSFPQLNGVSVAILDGTAWFPLVLTCWACSRTTRATHAEMSTSTTYVVALQRKPTQPCHPRARTRHELSMYYARSQ
jgi:hypothetical protein